MSENERRKPFWFLTNYEEGTGNIWGWKFSIYGGIFIAVLLAIAIYRHINMGVPLGYDPGAEKEINKHPHLDRGQNTDADTTSLEQN